VSDLLERAAKLFVAPPSGGGEPGAGRPRRPGRSRDVAPARPAAHAPCAVVLGAPADAVAVARLLSAELRLRTRAAAVLLAEWRAGELPPEAAGVAPAAARRVVERLAGHGIEASARGRTVHLPLPAEPVPAVAVLQRAVVAGGVPTVCALAGPRPARLDPLLEEQDLIVVAPPAAATSALTELALAGLEGVRAPVVVGRPVPRGAARLLAASSVATSRALGAAVTDAVRELA